MYFSTCSPSLEWSLCSRLIFMMTFLLVGCAKPGIDSLIPSQVSHPGASLETVFIVTDRAPDGPGQIGYGNDRAGLSYEELTISIPPGHRPGRVEWTSVRAKDPAASFVVVSRTQLDQKSFARRVAAGVRGGMAGVFVHGYNHSFQKAVFRVAQLAADVEGVKVPILFSWPSEGAVTGYVADRDAATFARDDLAHVLTLLSRIPTEGKIGLAGHSMGSWLIMETLRQFRLTKQDKVIAKFEVALAAPDIDIDVFRAQLSVIGPLNPPLTVLVATDDRALAVSRRLAAGRMRVGSINVQDPRLQEIAQRENLRIIDIAAVDASDGVRHDRFARFIALRGDDLTASGASASSVRRAGAFIFNTAGAAVASPFTLAGHVIAGH